MGIILQFLSYIKFFKNVIQYNRFVVCRNEIRTTPRIAFLSNLEHASIHPILDSNTWNIVFLGSENHETSIIFSLLPQNRFEENSIEFIAISLDKSSKSAE